MCAIVWSELKKIVLQNQWHLSQSYAMSHHNLIRLLRTSAEVDILSFLKNQKLDDQLQTLSDLSISRGVRLHLKELFTWKEDILAKYLFIVQQQEELDMLKMLH